MAGLGLSILDREDLVRMADLSSRVQHRDEVDVDAVKHVLLTLVRYTDSDGRHARPTQRTLALLTGTTDRKVRRALAVLQRRPRLIRPERVTRPGSHDGIAYAVEFERIADLVPDPPLDLLARMAPRAVLFVDRVRGTPDAHVRGNPGVTPDVTPDATSDAHVRQGSAVEAGSSGSSTTSSKGRFNPWADADSQDLDPRVVDLVARIVEPEP